MKLILVLASLFVFAACKSAEGPGRLALPREDVAFVHGVFEYKAFNMGSRTWILAVDGVELDDQPAYVDLLPGHHVLTVRYALPASLGLNRGQIDVEVDVVAGGTYDLVFEHVGDPKDDKYAAKAVLRSTHSASADASSTDERAEE